MFISASAWMFLKLILALYASVLVVIGIVETLNRRDR